MTKDLQVPQEKQTDSERAFLTAVDRYKTQSGRQFLTLIEMFRLARMVLGLKDEHEKSK
jgi:hypothetical protein